MSRASDGAGTHGCTLACPDRPWGHPTRGPLHSLQTSPSSGSLRSEGGDCLFCWSLPLRPGVAGAHSVPADLLGAETSPLRALCPSPCAKLAWNKRPPLCFSVLKECLLGPPCPHIAWHQAWRRAGQGLGEARGDKRGKADVHPCRGLGGGEPFLGPACGHQTGMLQGTGRAHWLFSAALWNILCVDLC